MAEMGFEPEQSRTARSVSLGRVVATRGARALVPPEELLLALNRHERADWGELSADELAANDRGLEDQARVRSAYKTSSGTSFWVVTDAGRSVTTVLLPEEASQSDHGGKGARAVRLPKALNTSSHLRVVTVELIPETMPLSGEVKGPEFAAELVRARIGKMDREHFIALHLSAKHRLQNYETVSVGTLTDTSVHPREVFKAALLSNAAAIICAHNHPSGDLTPSRQDFLVMQRLNEVGELLGIKLLDFLIVTTAGFRSLSEELRDLNSRT